MRSPFLPESLRGFQILSSLGFHDPLPSFCRATIDVSGRHIKTLIHRCGMTNTAIPAVAKRCHNWIISFHPYFNWTADAFWSSNPLISWRITFHGELWVIVRIIRIKHRNLLFLNQVRECRWRTSIVSQMIFRQREAKSKNVLKYNSTFCDVFQMWDEID